MTRMHAARLTLTGLVAACVCAPLTHAQPRTWGFDRDTVYEGRSDSVFISNQGSATLRFSSLIVESASPPNMDSVAVVFRIPTPEYPWSLHYFSGTTLNPPLQVAPLETRPLRFFQVDLARPYFPTKSSAAPNPGDTVLARLRFVAENGTSDTLFVRGSIEGYWNTALRFRPTGMKPSFLPSGSPRDLRGRVQPERRAPIPVFHSPARSQ